MMKERDMPSYISVSHIYKLFLDKKWFEMKSFYEENNFDVFLPLNHLKETALHLAVYSQDMDLVESLLKIVYKHNPFISHYPSVSVSDGFEFSLVNASGNTPLHEAASKGNVKLVKLILEYDNTLLNTRNNNGETPFFMAALYGQTKLIKYLLAKIRVEEVSYHFFSTTSTMIHEAIRGYYFEIALELLDPRYYLPMVEEDSDGMTCFQLLADIPSAFKSGYSFGILEKLIYDGLPVPEDKDESENNNVSPVNPSRKTDTKHGLPVPEDKDEIENNNVSPVNPSRKTDTKHGSSSKYFGWIWRLNPIGYLSLESLTETKKKHSIVEKLTKILAKDDTSWQDNTADGQRDTPLIAAAKNGIPEIVEAILDVFPEAIEHENHKKENVFHVAVQNHKANVLDLLESNKFKNPRLIEKFNADGDSILHKAAYKTDISSRERPGEALCLQSDIQWFERVKNMVPAHHINQQNKKEVTPPALFTEEHEKLIKKGQEWLIRTTNSCIIVAVLIATVAFTSIYTVPGGSDAKTGKPLLLNTTAFTVFTASDVASLCFAFTSVVVFLSITTSKMNEQDFRIWLPLKLVLGLSMLFFSVAALMIGFAATLVMTIRHRLHQAAAPIIAIACFPVAFFLILQLRLYANITWFTTKDLLSSLIDIIPKKCQPRSWTRSS
ncbi:uncharacterized protein LOC133733790 [Rosa rugosa]|uniref:uncharacterized protein LOC133733790 n=1 Tax=Rosa rugosa TaxID=74645 RepID=UPI002B40F616|nr:uncharacterized protein LOC133733790 [Rosa rugosa]